MGHYEFQSGETKFKGNFNIYQAKKGAIILLMGTSCIQLSYSQVNNLPINLYSLDDFDHDLFLKFYNVHK